MKEETKQLLKEHIEKNGYMCPNCGNRMKDITDEATGLGWNMLKKQLGEIILSCSCQKIIMFIKGE